jgi:hypothetical protein
MLSKSVMNMEIKPSVNIPERKYSIMQNNNYQTKQRRGSSPPVEELEWAMDMWMLGLRSIQKNPQGQIISNEKEVLILK